MEVTINVPGQDPLPLTLPSEDTTVADLKTLLEPVMTVPAADIKLTLGAMTLDNKRKVSVYTTHLKGNIQASVQKPVESWQLFFKTSGGRTITCDCQSNAYIKDVLEQVAAKIGMDSYHLVLKFQGTLLNKYHRLEDIAGVTKESTLHLFHAQELRTIDEENDIYPPPLLTTMPSEAVKGFDRIVYSMWYLRPQRLRQLILDAYSKEVDYSLFDKDFYQQNIVALSLQQNHPTNLFYNTHKADYESVMFTLFLNLRTDDMKRLMADLQQPLAFQSERPGLSVLIEQQLQKRPIISLVLWNFGCLFTEEQIDLLAFMPLVTRLKPLNDKPFEIGKRFQLLLGGSGSQCPITLQAIKKPAFLSTGMAYEFDAIGKHLLTKNTDPLTGLPLRSDKGKEHFKSIWLPEQNQIIHYDWI